MRRQKRAGCPELEKIQLYIDDLLPAAQAAGYAEHLSSCPECQSLLQSYQDTIGVLKIAADEPVPELDVSALRRRLFADGRRTYRRRPVLALASAAAVAVACLLVALVWVRPHHQEPSASAIGHLGVAPTGKGRIAVIRPDEHISLVPLEHGRVSHRRFSDGGTLVELSSGALFVKLDRPLAGRFVVDTPAGEVEATGTMFLVRVVGRRTTAVFLLQGTLVTRPRQGPEGELVAPAFGMLCKPVRQASLEPAPAPAAAGRQKHPDKRVEAGKPGVEKPLALVRRLLAERKIEPALGVLNEYLARAPDDPRAVLLLGDAHRLSERPVDALAAYQRVIRLSKNPRLAEAALYQAGLLQLHDLAQPAEALKTFERLVRDYPHGLLVQESFFHLAECRIAMKDFRAAMRVLDDYLAKYPRGTKAGEARTLLKVFEEKGWR